jgi:hypothetical protein
MLYMMQYPATEGFHTDDQSPSMSSMVSGALENVPICAMQKITLIRSTTSYKLLFAILSSRFSMF